MWILGKPVENIKVSDFCPNRGSIDSIHWVIYRFLIMSFIQTSDLPVSSSCARHPWDRGRLRCAVFDSKTVGLQVRSMLNWEKMMWLVPFFPNRRRLVINIFQDVSPRRSHVANKFNGLRNPGHFSDIFWIKNDGRKHDSPLCTAYRYSVWGYGYEPFLWSFPFHCNIKKKRMARASHAGGMDFSRWCWQRHIWPAACRSLGRWDWDTGTAWDQGTANWFYSKNEMIFLFR